MIVKKAGAALFLTSAIALVAACGSDTDGTPKAAQKSPSTQESSSYVSLDEDGGEHPQGDIELITSNSDELKIASVCMYADYTQLSKSRENREDYYGAVVGQTRLIDPEGLSADESRYIYSLAEKLPEDGWQYRDGGKDSDALVELTQACKPGQ